MVADVAHQFFLLAEKRSAPTHKGLSARINFGSLPDSIPVGFSLAKVMPEEVRARLRMRLSVFTWVLELVILRERAQV
ncbi:MAG TPA: hypothetical protein VHL58_02625 [Thermoanaerobaculia bacterium]|nr:hypothetical protein [Thermoanaerobaculia bacterium]